MPLSLNEMVQNPSCDQRSHLGPRFKILLFSRPQASNVLSVVQGSHLSEVAVRSLSAMAPFLLQVLHQLHFSSDWGQKHDIHQTCLCVLCDVMRSFLQLRNQRELVDVFHASPRGSMLLGQRCLKLPG